MTNTKDNHIERPPVVVVVGHVDHGKSTLLDYIRESNIVEGEAGGITQHLGAYEVTHVNDSGEEKRITFLDTPGHESFGTIRTRGAGTADIGILIIAADDGVQAQTKEALDILRQTETPFIVAINKTDLPSANTEKIVGELTEQEVYLEGRGGDVPFVEISAQTGAGVPELLELVLLVAEIEELTGDPSIPASGMVVEAHRDARKGITGTLVITNGTLKKGMHIATKSATAPVRIIESTLGDPLEEASFSAPVNIIGWNALPQAGDYFVSFASKKEAVAYLEKKQQETTSKQAIRSVPEEDEEEDTAVIPIIIKADTAGSIDAIKHEIGKIAIENVELKVVSADVGTVSETDIQAAGNDERAIVVGFNTEIDSRASELADRSDIKLKSFLIIYELAQWLKGIATKRKPKKIVEETRGKLKVLEHFTQNKSAQIIGGRVTDGAIAENDTALIYRRKEEIGSGRITELQENKKRVSSVEKGAECGLKVSADISIEPGDVLEARMEVAR